MSDPVTTTTSPDDGPVDHDYAVVSYDPVTLTVTYRASALGSCHHALLALRQGFHAMSPPGFMAEKFLEGHEAERPILTRTQSEADLTLFRINPAAPQDAVELVFAAPGALHGGSQPVRVIRVLGHVDGVGHDPEGVIWGVDAKALSEGSFKSWKARKFDDWPHYAWQMSAYAYGLGDLVDANLADKTSDWRIPGTPLGMVMAVLNKGTTGKAEGPVDTSGEIAYEWIPEPPIGRTAIFAKLVSVELAHLRGDVPECTAPEFLCPVWYLHPTDVEVQPPLPTEAAAALDAAATQYAFFRTMAKQAEEFKKALGDRMKALMADPGPDAEPVTKAVTPSGFTVSTYDHTSTSYDWDAFAEDHPDIDLARYKIVHKSPTVRVTEKRTR